MTSNLAQAIKRGTDSGAFTLPKGLAGKVKLASTKAAAGKEVSRIFIFFRTSVRLWKYQRTRFGDCFSMKGRQQKKINNIFLVLTQVFSYFLPLFSNRMLLPSRRLLLRQLLSDLRRLAKLCESFAFLEN